MVEIIGWTMLALGGLSLVAIIIGLFDDCNETLIGGGCFGGFVFFVGFSVCAVIEHVKDNKRLLKQCMDSGKQEFECVSMLREPSSTVIPLPMIIPMR